MYMYYISKHSSIRTTYNIYVQGNSMHNTIVGKCVSINTYLVILITLPPQQPVRTCRFITREGIVYIQKYKT